jgi:hypothetical protein
LTIVPDSGYIFAGWSHDAYISLRGKLIPADSGVMHLDTLTLYGNVDLRASFAPAPEAVAPEDDVLLAAATAAAAAKDSSAADSNRGLTTRRLHAPGISIVTLDGGPGWKVAVRM